MSTPHPTPALSATLTPDQEARIRALATELRCLVCQNQSIADSQAPLALDLRQQIHEQVLSGHSDDEVRQFMTARYGDFILYRPPLDARTSALWLGPGVLAGAGLLGLWAVLRRRARLSNERIEVPPQAPASETAPGWRTWALMLLFVAGLSAVLYGQLGRTEAWSIAADEPAAQARDAEHWAMMGRMQVMHGQHAQAVDSLRRATTLAPTRTAWLLDLADALAVTRQRRLDGEPAQLIAQALAREPDNVKALALMGLVHFQRGDFGPAVQTWERALAVAPPSASAHWATQLGPGLHEARRRLARQPAPDQPASRSRR